MTPSVFFVLSCVSVLIRTSGFNFHLTRCWFFILKNSIVTNSLKKMSHFLSQFFEINCLTAIIHYNAILPASIIHRVDEKHAAESRNVKAEFEFLQYISGSRPPGVHPAATLTRSSISLSVYVYL